MSKAACKKENGNCTVAVDPDDRFPVQCVGPWAREKHFYIAKYFAATRAVRARYVTGERAGGAGIIDLFAGPGRARIRDVGEFIDGTPMIALKQENITDIILCDLDRENVAALKARTAHRRCVTVLEGDCNRIIADIVDRIPRQGYSVALLDPFGPLALNFATIRRLAAFPRMDLIIHFPLGSMKRNWFYRDRFASLVGLPPEKWGIDMHRASDITALMGVLRRQLQNELGYPDHGIELCSPRITNSSNTTLYHLMFASKHERGDTIWKSITKTAPSGQMQLL